MIELLRLLTCLRTPRAEPLSRTGVDRGQAGAAAEISTRSALLVIAAALAGSAALQDRVERPVSQAQAQDTMTRLARVVACSMVGRFQAKIRLADLTPRARRGATYHWQPAGGSTEMQLDIFDHSRDVMLRNDVVHALERRDAVAARAACQRLGQEFPLDDSLPAFRTLAEAIEGGARPPFEDPLALTQARESLQETVRPAALRVFGSEGARAWLVPLWEGLAGRAEALPFRADRAQDHAASLWMQAANWRAMAHATATIESWRRIPAPLAWMVQARLQLFGLHATWPMVAELGWMSAGRLDALLRQSKEPLMSALLRKFDAEFEGTGDAGDTAWFAAWVLTERPEVAQHLARAQPSQHGAPERAMRVLIELLGLERQGRHHDLIERRKALRDLHPSLYAAYMKTR